MKTKKFLLTGLLFVALTCVVSFALSMEKGRLSLTTENEKAFAQAIEIHLHFPTPSSEGYCRCKHGGCYSGNMISFRANCGMGSNGCNSQNNCDPT